MDSPHESLHQAWHGLQQPSWRQTTLFLSCLLFFAAGSAHAQGSTIRVPQDKPTIQEAIDAALTGGIVLVDRGTYGGVGNVNLTFRGKGITVRSVGGAERTFIDAAGGSASGFIFSQGETATAVLEGFTIRHASRSAITITDASPTLQHCVLDSNSAGGVSITSSSSSSVAAPLLRDLVIQHNTTAGGGGGLYINTRLNSRPRLESCQILGNTAIDRDSGVGIGGGLYIAGGAPELVNCLIAGNSAPQGYGGGMSVTGSEAQPMLRFCTLTGNSSDYGGLYLGGEATATVQNSILWGNGTQVFLANTSKGISLTYSLVQGGLNGFGGNSGPRTNSTYLSNLDADPLFVNAPQGDYRLQPGSPAIDAGLAGTGVEWDIRGYARSLGRGPDLGAYESPIEPFTEIGQLAGVAGDARNNSAGTAFLDYDGDGDLDLYLAKAGSDRLYRNEGNGTFTEVSASAGIADDLGGRGVFSGDYDNDGDLDLYITTTGASLLYRNEGNGTFKNVAPEAGVAESGTGAAFADYDRDSDLDLYVAKTSDRRLYRNNGNGTFTEVSKAAGVADNLLESRGVSFADYDGDGDLDFYLATANNTLNRLYRNNGNGTFTDVAPGTPLANNQSGTAVSWVDYDNDGDFDLHFLVHGNRSWLYRNNNNGTFTNVAIAAGISGPTLGWGAAWGDYDGDGRLDLYLSNNGANQLYRNNGNGTFTDVAPGTPLADTTFSQGASFGDFDRDGDLDLYVANNNSRNLLFRNNRDDRHFLFVRVLDARGHYNRHGSAVFMRESGTGELVGARLVGGTAYFAGNAYDAHFGLDPDRSYEVEVRFPDGSTYALGNVIPAQLPGQLLVVRQPLALATIPDTAAGYGASVTVPIQLVNQTSSPIINAELDIVYDAAVITSLNLQLPSYWLTESRRVPGLNRLDTLKVAMAAVRGGVSEAGDLLSLLLRTADIRHPLQTTIKLTRVVFNEGQVRVDARGGVLRLRGTNGLLTTNLPAVVSRQSVRISLNDPDENRTTRADSLQVRVFNGARTDSERVWLFEGAAASGLFNGVIATAFPSPIVIGDRLLSLAAGDSLVVAYLDSLTASGATETRFAQTRIIPEVAGKLQATRVLQAQRGRVGQDTLRIQIVDPALNLSATRADTVRWVTVRNFYRVGGAQLDSVALFETGPNTGIFRQRVPTVLGDLGTRGDNIVTIEAGDTLTIRRSDGTFVLAHVIDRFGDLNRNGVINAEDAYRILQVSSGTGAVSLQDSLVADVDGDNNILPADASLVLQYGLGMINRFPVQTDTVFSAADQKNHPFLKPVASGNLLAFGTPQAEAGGTFLVPLQLTERDGVLSGQLRLDVGPGLELVEVLAGAGYSDYLLAHTASEGSAGIVFAGARSPARGAGEVVRLRLRPTGEAQSVYHLSLNEVVLNRSAQSSPPQQLSLSAADLLPRQFALHPNQPNPFNPSTLIRYDLAKPGLVELTIYNLQGQKVRTFALGRQPAGAYQQLWDGKDQQGRPVGSGVYLAPARRAVHPDAQDGAGEVKNFDSLIDEDTSYDNIPIVTVSPLWSGPFKLQTSLYALEEGYSSSSEYFFCYVIGFKRK